ncbi:MAG: hypothetical protein AAFX39_12990 [Pseudomonadota bacterium]
MRGLLGFLCLFGVAMLLTPVVALAPAKAQSEETIVGYIPENFTIDGWRLRCRGAQTVLVPDFGHFGAAVPGTILLDPDRLADLPASVQIFIFGHECAHQFVGANEPAADCLSAMVGRREGWLDRTGLEEVCRFIRPFRATSVHPSGPERCRIIRSCFAEVRLLDRETVGRSTIR